MCPAFAACTIALGSGAAEELRHGRAGPASALPRRQANGVEMLDNGVWCFHPGRLGSLHLRHDMPHERLYLVSRLYHSLNIQQQYGMSPSG